MFIVWHHLMINSKSTCSQNSEVFLGSQPVFHENLLPLFTETQINITLSLQFLLSKPHTPTPVC